MHLSVAESISRFRHVHRAARVMSSLLERQRHLVFKLGRHEQCVTSETKELGPNHLPQSDREISAYRDAVLAVLAAPSRIENGPELFLRLVPHALDIPPGQWKEVELPQLIYRLTENCWGWNRTPWASCHKTQEYIAALPRKALLSLAWYLKDVAAKQNGQAGDLEQSRAWLPTDKAIELLKENQAIRIMGLQLKDRTYYRHGLIWEGTKLAELLLLNYIPSTELFHVSGTFDYAFSGTLKQFQPGDVHWVLLTKGRDPLVDDTPDPQIEPPVSLAG